MSLATKDSQQLILPIYFGDLMLLCLDTKFHFSTLAVGHFLLSKPLVDHWVYVDNLTMTFKEIWVDWICLAQDMVRWQVLMNMVMSL